jgi:hypothetical protein
MLNVEINSLMRIVIMLSAVMLSIVATLMVPLYLLIDPR